MATSTNLKTERDIHPEGTWVDAVTGEAYPQLADRIETVVERIKGELIPELKKPVVLQAKLSFCADRLNTMIDDFDANCPPPYNTRGMSTADITRSFDHSMVAVAKMFKELYRQLKHCTFTEHAAVLRLAKDIVEEFDQATDRDLRNMGLGYYEAGKLLFTVDSKLGVESPPESSEKHQRRRSLLKEPDDIENALVDCLNTIIPLRDKIVSIERQDKFDELILRTCAKLGAIPVGEEGPEAVVDAMDEKFKAARLKRLEIPEDEDAKGERVKRLLSACATIQKIYKWVRKVDLQSTEISTSRKQQVLDAFDDLSNLARGRDTSLKEKL